MMTFRNRTLLYIACFTVFIVVWRLWDTSSGRSEATPNTFASQSNAAQSPEPSSTTVQEEISEGSDDPSPTPEPTTLAASTPPARVPLLGGLAPLEWPTDPATPADPLGALLQQGLSATLLNPLTGQPDGDALASDWQVEGSTTRFTLRPSVDSTAVIMALREARRAGQLPAVTSIRVEGRTLFLESERENCGPLWQSATWPIAIREPERLTDTSWEVPARPSTWTYQQFPDEASLREAWARGELDGVVGAQGLTGGPPLDSGNPGMPTGQLVATLLFNTNDSVLDGQPLRAALTLATDREALFREAYDTEPALLSALLPPGHWAAPETSLDYDPNEATDLLEAQGWRDRDDDGLLENLFGDPLAISIMLPLSEDQRWELLGHRLAQQWREIGVQAEPLFLADYTVQERLHYGEWQVALLAFQSLGDPDQRAVWRAPTDEVAENEFNVTGYDEPDVEALFNEAADLPGCTLADQQALYQAAWEQLLDDKPLWPLFALPADLWLKDE